MCCMSGLTAETCDRNACSSDSDMMLLSLLGMPLLSSIFAMGCDRSALSWSFNKHYEPTCD
jgi:hypothetical protein